MTVYATTDTKKGRTGIAPTYLQTTRFRCSHVFYTSISILNILKGSFQPIKRSQCLALPLSLSYMVIVPVL